MSRSWNEYTHTPHTTQGDGVVLALGCAACVGFRMNMNRKNLYLTDELWDRVREAALKESVRAGRVVSASEWVRRACESRLEQEEAKARP